MKSPPQLLDTILIAADKDGSVLIYRSSGIHIGSLLYRLDTPAKVICLFLTQELDIPYFTQPSSVPSHHSSIGIQVVRSNVKGVATATPDSPHLVYMLEDAIMGYIDLRTIPSLCSSSEVVTGGEWDIADRATSKRPQISTVTHMTSSYLYHDLNGDAVDASSSDQASDDINMTVSVVGNTTERGVGVHRRINKGNMLTRSFSKLKSIVSSTMVADESSSSIPSHALDDDESSIRRGDDTAGGSNLLTIQEEIHQNKVNQLDISCCVISKIQANSLHHHTSHNCYIYILIGRKDGSLCRKIFYSTRRSTRHDLLSTDTSDLNSIDRSTTHGSITTTAAATIATSNNRKGSLNINRSIDRKDRKVSVNIASNDRGGGGGGSSMKGKDSTQALQLQTMHRSDPNISTSSSSSSHNSSNNNNQQQQKQRPQQRSHSHLNELIEDSVEAIYDPIQRMHLSKTSSINRAHDMNNTTDNIDSSIPLQQNNDNYNDDGDAMVGMISSVFDEVSMTSDIEINDASMTDLQSQHSNSSIWSSQVVDQVKASLRRINLHSSHSNDRLHLKPLVYRREKTPSRASVIQVNCINNRNRDSKDRKVIVRPKRSNLEPIDIQGRRVTAADKHHSLSTTRNQVNISTFRVNFYTETSD